MPFPYIFTFYSYKGGVGRSMAVMNVAYTLAGRGRHVLVVDMDLEAPGLSGFLHRSNELAETGLDHPKDVLTLLGEAIKVVRDNGAANEAAKDLPPVSNYIRAVAEEKLSELRPQLGQLGRLDILGTDLDRNYPERLAQLDLPSLAQDRLIALSRLLHHYFKAQVFPHRPLGVEVFESPLPTPYDYVLVDSRTGITEIGGLCVGPLAERLVVITGLNDQNVQGTLDFMREAGIRPRPRSKNDQPWDDADTLLANGADNATLGPKPAILVASPVPTGEIAYKRRRLEDLATLLGIRPVSLSYHPQMALMESVFVRDYPEEYLAGEYKRLATSLMAQVGDEPQQLASRSRAFFSDNKDLSTAISAGLRLASHFPELGISLLQMLAGPSQEVPENHARESKQLHALLSQNAGTRAAALNNWGLALSREAKTKAGEEADQFFEESARKYAEALSHKPDFYEALSNWGIALSNQAKRKTGEEAERLFEESGRKYADALRLKPDFHEALYNWGASLSDQAKAKAGDEADQLFKESGSKFAEAVRLKQDFPQALNNWGNALTNQAKMKAGEEANQLLEDAGHKYAEALRLKPDFHEALYNWGTALSHQANTKTGEEADHLFEEARRKYAEVLRLRPGHYEALLSWGNSLSSQSKKKAGEHADQLFEEAGRKYAEALRLKPDHYEALNNWGVALSVQASTKSEEVAENLLREAQRKFVEAERIHAGSAAYNLARIEARRGNANEAVRWLKISESAGKHASRVSALADNAFDGVRDQPEFVSFVRVAG